MSLFYSLIASDEQIIIKGVIMDKQTGEPISFAHITIGNKITITDINGEFAVPIENPSKRLVLKISYQGYETHIEEVTDFNKYYKIFIVPSTIRLDDIRVRSGPEIMRNVFNNFFINYTMESQLLEAYYRETMKDTMDYCYVTEGIMNIYTPSNIDRFRTPIVKLQRSRKKIYKPVDEENFLTGNASDMAHSSIWRFDSFLGEKNRDNYHYFYDGTSTIGDHSVLIVDFEPKNEKGNTSGTLFIDNVTYAILRIEYHPDTEESEFWDNVSWTEEYELLRGSFDLVSTTFNGVADGGNKLYTAVLIVHHSHVEYDTPSDEELMDIIGINDTFIKKAEDDTQGDFWEGFHTLKLNDRVAAQISTQKHDF
ncbi:MAG: carboxypeptidase-like regulatory domain-containing protein [Bacteroidota bacterium]